MNKVPGAQPSILHLHSTFSAGGKELRCVQIINALARHARHTIVSALPERIEAAELISKSVSVTLLQDFPPLQGLPTPGRLHRLAQAMRSFDLILTYNWGAMDAVMAHTLFGSALSLPPLIHHEDGFNEDERDRLKRRRNIYRRLGLSNATGLVVPSQNLERIAHRAWHQPRPMVRRIANGIDTRAFAMRPKRDSLPGVTKQDGEFWVGTLAGLRPVKNLPHLVRSFAGLPEAWKLVIVGEGPEQSAIEAEARRLGVLDRVLLPGFVAQPSRYVGLFDIFALSSQTEQFPISVVEAMAAAVPVAAHEVGDIAAMVSSENRRFIAGSGDDAVLSHSLEALANDAALRKTVGEANRVKALAQFDEGVMLESYAKLYWRAMGRPAPRLR